MGRGGRKGKSHQTAPPKAPGDSVTQAPESPPIDFAHLRPVPKNRGLLIVSSLLLALWFVALVALVLVSRS